MSEPVHTVYILVCKVYAACKCSAPVNNADFSVVAVVQNCAQGGSVRVERNAWNTRLAQFFGITVRQRGNASHIIVDNAHVYAVINFAVQNIKNGIPHNSMLNNKIFYENVFFSFFKLLNERFKKTFAGTKILCEFFFIKRNCGSVRYIKRLRSAMNVDFFKLVYSGIFCFVDSACKLGVLKQNSLLFAAQLCRPEHDVKHTAENRHKRNQQRPGQLYRRVCVLVDNAKNHYKA